ncbi:MAG: hypothetical protein ACOC9V_00110 [Chloroflexota bacterium]
MDWNRIGHWAEEMDSKAKELRRERLKIAAEHFGVDVLDILGDHDLETRLLARYEEAGLEWPSSGEESE